MTVPRLPPLTSLRAFEAAARRASFKAAAEELGVTPTAISHQVRQLEDHLGLRVLNRSPRAVTLTPEGKALCEVIATGFGEIARVVAELRAGTAPVRVTLSSTTTLLSQWLVPRLDALRHAVPGIDLRLHASHTAEILRAGAIDVAIRYGAGPFPGVTTHHLGDDRLIAVCSPRLGLSRVEDLRHTTLLHIDGRNLPAPGWSDGCAQAGIDGVDTDKGLRFPDSMLAVQAAIAGHGVVLVSRRLVVDALKAGLLVSPFALSLAGDAYHFVCADGLDARPDIVALRRWLQEAFREGD